MVKHFLTLLFAISVPAAVTLGQTGFSESKPYEPKGDAKLDRKKATTPIAASQVIVIPVSVLDETGMPAPNLAKANFSVMVDGAETPVTAFEKTVELPNIILLLDMSPSTQTRIQAIRDQASRFVEALPADAKVIVADFHSEMNIRAQLTSNREEVLRGISKTKVGDGTSLYSAMRTLLEKVLPPVTGRKVIVLFTDGVDTTSRKSSFASSLHDLEKGDVSVYTVVYDTFIDFPKPGARIGPLADRFGIIITGPPGRGRQAGTSESEYEAGRDYLKTLASMSGGRVFASDKFELALKSLVAELSTRYHLTVSVPQTGTAASRPLKVRINRPNLIVNARGSFIE